MKSGSLVVDTKNVASSLAQSSGPAVSIQEALGEGRPGGLVSNPQIQNTHPALPSWYVVFGGLRSCPGDGGNVTFQCHHRCPVDLSLLVAFLTQVTQLVSVQARTTAPVF